MNKPIVNMAASVREKLLNLARDRRGDFGLILTKYGLERVLHRISQLKHREAFVLKGALLFELWTLRPDAGRGFSGTGPEYPREVYIDLQRDLRNEGGR